MLIFELINDIKTIHKQLQEDLNQKTKELEAQNTHAYEQNLAKLKEQIHTDFEEKISQKLLEFSQNLADTTQQALQSSLEELKSAQSSQSLAQIELSAQKLHDELNAQYALLAQKLEESLPQELLQSLKPLIAQSLEQHLLTNLEPALDQKLKDVDLSDKINYEKIHIDMDTLLTHIKKDKELQNSLKTQAKEANIAFWHSTQGEKLLQDELKSHARGVFEQAMRSDELIKLRYESALRLESIQMIHACELIAHIEYILAKNAHKAPQMIKNNILCVK